MSWLTFHVDSEKWADAAEEALRGGDKSKSESLFARAARSEAQALELIGTVKSRTFGITAVSAVSLWYKASKFVESEQLAHKALATNALPGFAVEQLRTLLQTIWNEQAQRQSRISFLPGQVLISVRGGEVVTGGAPLDLILEKVETVKSLFFRTAEYLKDLPLRRRGVPSKDIQKLCRPWLFQSVPSSYQFAVAVEQPQQFNLFPRLESDPQLLTETFLSILRNASEDPEEGLKAIVSKEEYRITFLKMTRNLAPSGRVFNQMEIAGASETQPIVLSPASRALISDFLRKPREEIEVQPPIEEVMIKGVLRALDLDKDWLEVSSEGENLRVEGVGDTVDDLIGPMVNQSVLVRAYKGKGKKLKFSDIEREE